MSTKRARVAGCVALVVLAVTPAVAIAKSTIVMSGSTSVAPLAAKLASAFNKKYNHEAIFRLSQGGSDIGVSDVSAGRVTIGNSSRDPKPTDAGGLQWNKIARDAVCVVTSPQNKVASLSQAQVQALFSGQVKDWSQIPGSTVSGAPDVIVRTAPSGTQDAFQKIFLGTAKVTTSAQAKASNGLVQQAVKSDPRAIGYVSLAFGKGLNDAGYKGVACNERNAKAGTYGGVRNFWMVTRGPAKGEAKKFISWIKHSSTANSIIGNGWVPLH